MSWQVVVAAVDTVILLALMHRFFSLAIVAAHSGPPFWWPLALITQGVFNLAALFFTWWGVGEFENPAVAGWATAGHLLWLVILVGFNRGYDHKTKQGR
mgnify:CR=1 FL=1